MSLFEVPGWSVKAAPVREESQQVSKKRKRPSSHTQMESAEVNVEKLMARLANAHPEVTSTQTPESKKRKKTPRQKDASKVGAEGTKAQPTMPSRASEKIKQSSDNGVGTATKSAESKPKKKAAASAKTKNAADSSSTQPSVSTPIADGQRAQKNSNLTALQKSMKESLDGARFR